MSSRWQILAMVRQIFLVFLSVCLLQIGAASVDQPDAQLAKKFDDTCAITFNVPRDFIVSDCRGQEVLEQEVKALQDTVKVQQDTIKTQQQQITTLQQQTAALQQVTKAQQQQTTALQQQVNALITQQSVANKEIADLRRQVQSLTSVTSKPTPRPVQPGSGVAYIRWGRTACNSQATVLYKGYAAGNHYTVGGGGGNYICLPDTPQWKSTRDGFQGGSRLYGAEYEVSNGYGPFSTANNGGKTLHDNDAPCVSCYVPSRSAVIMIPARVDCPSGWTREYWGYLVAEHASHNARVYECMDEAPEVQVGGHANHNGALFYHVETECGSLPCPKYVGGWEVTCVVCTK